MGYSPWGRKELDATEHTPTFHRRVLLAGQGSVTSSLSSLQVPSLAASCPHPGLHPRVHRAWNPPHQPP